MIWRRRRRRRTVERRTETWRDIERRNVRNVKPHYRGFRHGRMAYVSLYAYSNSWTPQPKRTLLCRPRHCHHRRRRRWRFPYPWCSYSLSLYLYYSAVVLNYDPNSSLITHYRPLYVLPIIIHPNSMYITHQ